MAITAEDYFEIHNLYGKYSFAVDYGDAEGWADTYTDDGRFVSQRDEAVGRQQLVAYIHKYVKLRGIGVRHYPTNIVIEAEGDGAKGRAYLTFASKRTGDEPYRPAVMRYEDRLVRTPGGWRFKERRVVPD